MFVSEVANRAARGFDEGDICSCPTECIVGQLQGQSQHSRALNPNGPFPCCCQCLTRRDLQHCADKQAKNQTAIKRICPVSDAAKTRAINTIHNRTVARDAIQPAMSCRAHHHHMHAPSAQPLDVSTRWQGHLRDQLAHCERVIGATNCATLHVDGVAEWGQPCFPLSPPRPADMATRCATRECRIS